ncbi:MAG: cytochrome c oxidase accessory protein CcoG [Ideonella sp.]
MSKTRANTIPIYPAAPDAAAEVVSMYAKQPTIYARSVHGWFAGWRWALVWLTQLLFYGLPWLSWNDRPAVLLDLAARRFYIGPLLLYPQDFIYLTGLLIVSAYGLFLFTAVAGRLWCGFACPQTVYTEIFMWVERKIEGDRIARMKRDAGPWTADKLLRRGAKQFVWISIGLWTGFTFVGYFTPIRELAAEALGLSFGPWEWFWVLFYGFATYGNAGYMREQVCKYMCPYARFQSAMFDKDTLTISYDPNRGEPRGSRPRSTPHAQVAAQGKGDCIDCGLCVQVCPTGIDIRDGLQYECIGCTACVDVCNGVMDKMSYPRGLIRYATENELIHGWSKAKVLRRVFRPRVLIYSVILLLISTAFVASLALRKPFRVDVIRDRGALARQVDDGQIENVYRLQLMNATESPQRYLIGVSGQPGLSIASQSLQSVDVAPADARWVVMIVRMPPEAAAKLGGGAHPMQFEVSADYEAGGKASVIEPSTFVVPR